jgi:hypothetical protein
VLPKFTYDTYQDVRRNLFLYSIIPLNIAGFIVYTWILPPSHQKAVSASIDVVSNGLWMKGISGLLVFSLFAFLIVEIFKFHDRVYDRYVIKWRLRYSTDFIVPRLLQPFLSQTDTRIFANIENHMADFMERVYYPFVGDRDLKIGKNLLVRFYERITIYWMTQINEVVIVAVVFLVTAYWLFGFSNDVAPYGRNLLGVLLFAVACFGLNRLWVANSREAVREATAREIDAIIQGHLEDLRGRVRAFCQQHSITNSV